MTFAAEDGLPDGERHLALAERLRQAERRAAIFRVASALGHMIGTPLNVIAGRAALIRALPDQGDSADHARRIEEQVERLAYEVRRLIEYLTPPDTSSEPAPIASVVEDALSLCGPEARQHGVSIAFSDTGSMDVTVDRTSTLLVLTTLLSLAARSSAAGATLRLRALPETTGKAVSFDLVVPGMRCPAARIDRLEAPDHPEGVDVDAMQALAICSGVAQRRGGSVRFGLDEEKKTVVSFVCPRVS